MVEDRITDGRRIAELLSSELSGLTDGVLGGVAVVDAEPDATPSPEGTFAYAIDHDGDRVATVLIEPNAAVLQLATPLPSDAVPDRPDLDVRDDPATPDRSSLVIGRGAAVKPAVDVLRSSLRH